MSKNSDKFIILFAVVVLVSLTVDTISAAGVPQNLYRAINY